MRGEAADPAPHVKSPQCIHQVGRPGGAAVIERRLVMFGAVDDVAERCADPIARDRFLAYVTHAEVDVHALSKVVGERRHHPVNR